MEYETFRPSYQAAIACPALCADLVCGSQHWWGRALHLLLCGCKSSRGSKPQLPPSQAKAHHTKMLHCAPLTHVGRWKGTCFLYYSFSMWVLHPVWVLSVFLSCNVSLALSSSQLITCSCLTVLCLFPKCFYYVRNVASPTMLFIYLEHHLV